MRKNKTAPSWENSIKNPANREYVDEIAFNKDKKARKVTQEEFNQRYGVKDVPVTKRVSILHRKTK